MIPEHIIQDVHRYHVIQDLWYRMDDIIDDKAEEIVKEWLGWNDDSMMQGSLEAVARDYMMGYDIVFGDKPEIKIDERGSVMVKIDTKKPNWDGIMYLRTEGSDMTAKVNMAYTVWSDAKRLVEMMAKDREINGIRAAYKKIDELYNSLDRRLDEEVEKWARSR